MSAPIRRTLALVALLLPLATCNGRSPTPMVDPPDSDHLPWPIAEPGSGYDLGATDGQYHRSAGSSGGLFHNGVDLLAPEGTEVRAVEAGKVVRIDDYDSDPDVYDGVLVASADDLDQGFLYSHLVDGSITVNLGDEVAVGQLLGTVTAWMEERTYDHVHLQWVRGDESEILGGAELWSTDNVSRGNTLSRLDFALDDAPPDVRPVEPERPFLVYALASKIALPDGQEPLAAGEPLTGKVMIAARIEDAFRSDSARRIAPCTVECELRHPGSEEPVASWTAVSFTEEIPYRNAYAESVYSQEKGSTSIATFTERELYFVVTREMDDALDPIDSVTGTWDTAGVEPGEYELEVTARDLAGGENSLTMPVVIGAGPQ